MLGTTTAFFVFYLAYQANADTLLQAKHHLESTPRKYYWTEVKIPHGKKFEVACPRGQPYDTSDVFDGISILGGRYSSSFDTSGTSKCVDKIITRDLQTQCRAGAKCTISANDPSAAAGCSKRPLRVRFMCKNPRQRAVMVSHIVD